MTVTLESTGAAATLYSDNGITALSSNVLTTDANGFYSYYAADGRYTEVISGTNLTSRTIPGIVLDDNAAPTDYSAVAGGTADAMTVSLASVTAYSNLLQLNVRAPGANTVTTPTINVSGLGAITITRRGGAALAVGDYVANQELILRYNATSGTFEILNFNPVSAADLSDTGTDKGSDLVNHADDGTGAVPITVRDVLHYKRKMLEYYGGVAYPTRAAALDAGAVDSATAFVKALATGKPLQFRDGFYKIGSAISLAFNSGKSINWRGAGNKSDPTDTIGTTFVKGGAVGFDLFKFSGVDYDIEGLALDGNDLGGALWVLDGCKYFHFGRLSFFRQGGSDYCMRTVEGNVSFVNVGDIEHLKFSAEAAAGYIRLHGNMLYSELKHIVMGGITSGAPGIDIGYAGKQISSVKFADLHIDSAISLHDTVEKVKFDDLTQEAISLAPSIKLYGAAVRGTKITNWRMQRQVDQRFPALDATFAVGTTVEDVQFADTFGVGAGRRSFIQVDDIDNMTIKDVIATSTEAYDYINCVNHAATQLVVMNVNDYGTGNGRHIFFADPVTLIGGNVPFQFTAGNVSCLNVGSNGAATLANVGNYVDVAGSSNQQHFTGTLTGGTTAPTYDIKVTRVGNQITLDIPAMTVTSNAVTKLLTGLPSQFRPTNTKTGRTRTLDNGGAYTDGFVVISAAGPIEYFTSINVGAWTAAGTTLIDSHQITYTLT